MAGEYYETTDPLTSLTQAFYLDSPTSRNIVLIPRISGYDNCQAGGGPGTQGLNDSKEVVGTCHNGAGTVQVAFSWSSAKGTKQLPGLPNCTQDAPEWIRADRTIAVQSTQCSGQPNWAVHNQIVNPDGTVTHVPNYCTGAGEYFGLTTVADDGTLGGSARE
jgi:hypothetical protein